MDDYFVALVGTLGNPLAMQIDGRWTLCPRSFSPASASEETGMAVVKELRNGLSF